jgi:hypothetical protein
MFPQFLGIGAQKAGTTWLHANLSACDQIWLPHLKELHYFDRKFPLAVKQLRTGSTPRQQAFAKHLTTRMKRLNFRNLIERFAVRRRSDIIWEFRYLFGSWNDDWYESLFSNAEGRIAGEITPAYSCLPIDGIAHVKTLMPDVKLILLLRDPIERAWSHARMDLMHRTGRSLHSVSDREFLAHFESLQSRARGDYVGALDRWLLHFQTSQLFIGYYDEIVSSPHALFARILTFLGVSQACNGNTPNLRVHVNPGVEASLAPDLRAHLARIYVEQLQALANRLGSYPASWLWKCESAIARTRSIGRSATP